MHPARIDPQPSGPPGQLTGHGASGNAFDIKVYRLAVEVAAVGGPSHHAVNHRGRYQEVTIKGRPIWLRGRSNIAASTSMFSTMALVTGMRLPFLVAPAQVKLPG